MVRKALRHHKKIYSYHSILKQKKKKALPPRVAIIAFAAWLARSVLPHTGDQARSVEQQRTDGRPSVSRPYVSGGPLRLAAGSMTMLPPL